VDAPGAHPAKRYLITCAPPNPNGDLHLGHLSGPFLGADVLRRYLRQRGHDAHYVSYTDDFSPYVLRKAEEIDRSPQETAFTYSRRMVETLGIAEMLPDYYEHPFREPIHEQTVRRWFLELWGRPALYVADTPVFYCQRCGRYLYEAHVRGNCQHCGEPSDGLYCEECGTPQDPAGLRRAICIRCKAPPVLRSVRRLVFPLDTYRQRLRSYFEESSWRSHVRMYCLDLTRARLPDTPVSRLSPYGIAVPLEGWDGHILDTWFSGIFGYMASTAAYGQAIGRPNLWEEMWRDPSASVVHFIGFDCSFSHALLWPALLMALGELNLPAWMITNEFYRLEGEKFSTSRGHAIWGLEFLREVSADAVRFYLSLTGPEEEQTTFSMKEFVDVVNTALVDRLEAWESRMFDLLREDCESIVPDRDGAAQGEVEALVRELPSAMDKHLDPDTFSLRGAAHQVLQVLDVALPSLQALGTGRSAGREYRAALAAHVHLLATCAAVFAPLMPGWAHHVWKSLNGPYVPRVEPRLPWPEEGAPLVSPQQQVAASFRTLFHRV
jgi:methionyl-tRNA synthetase